MHHPFLYNHRHNPFVRMKTCGRCGIPQSIFEFGNGNRWPDKLRPDCKTCRSKDTKKYREANPDKIEVWNRKRPSYTNKRKPFQIVPHSEILSSNRETVKLSRKTNPFSALVRDLDTRIAIAFKRKGWNKTKSTYEIVGINREDLKKFIENKFKQGMTWNNREWDGWHVDHIIPLSSARSPEELIKLCHYTNMQPLWAEENRKKTNKMPNDGYQFTLC